MVEQTARARRWVRIGSITDAWGRRGL